MKKFIKWIKHFFIKDKKPLRIGYHYERICKYCERFYSITEKGDSYGFCDKHFNYKKWNNSCKKFKNYD